MPAGSVTYSQRLIAAVVATGLTVLLLNVSGLFGLMGGPLYLLVAVPAAYVQMRYGLVSGVVSIVLSSLIFSGQYGLGGELFEYLSLFGLPSLFLPNLLRRGWPWDKAVALTVVSVLLVVSGLTMAVIAAEQSTFSAYVDRHVEAQLEHIRTVIPADQEMSPELQRDLRLAIQAVEERLRQAFPAFIILGFTAIALILVWLLALLSGKHYSLPGTRFVAWKAPEQLIWVLIVAGFVFFVTEGVTKQIGLNLLIVLLLVYFVQGLAVVTEFFERSQFPLFLRVMGYSMALIFGPLPFAGIGVFDLWIDFRKIRIKGN